MKVKPKRINKNTEETLKQVPYVGNSECSTQKNIKEDEQAFRKMNNVKSRNKPPDGGEEQKPLVNVEDASCNLIMGIHTKDLYDFSSPGLIIFYTSPQEVLQMEPITYKVQQVLSRIKRNSNITNVRDTILADAAESSTDGN